MVNVALTVWDGRISPVFDVSREALVLTVEDGGITSRRRERIETATPWPKIDRLIELGVATLICGAISQPLQRELTVRGVEVIGFVAGEIEEIVASYLAGELPCPAHSMPGFGGARRQRLRYRGGRGTPTNRDRRGNGRRRHSKKGV